MSKSKALVATEEQTALAGSVFENGLEGPIWDAAGVLAKSTFVPPTFKNNPGECFVALELARTMGESALVIMQNVFLLKGKPGWGAPFVIARFNRMSGCAPIRWRVDELKPKELESNGRRYENLKVVAYSTGRSGETIEGEVDTKMAIGEGWVNNPKYNTMIRQMLKYRAATFLVRAHAPEVLMYMQTSDELEDVGFAKAGPGPESSETEPKPAVAEVMEEDGGWPKKTQKLVDAFRKINIEVPDIELYVKGSVDSLSEDEIEDLRDIHNAITKDGKKWSDFVTE